MRRNKPPKPQIGAVHLEQVITVQQAAENALKQASEPSTTTDVRRQLLQNAGKDLQHVVDTYNMGSSSFEIGAIVEEAQRLLDDVKAKS